jgi:hypothetical protein
MYRFPGALILFLSIFLVGSSMGQPAPGDSCSDPFEDAENVAFDPAEWETNFCKHSVPFAEIQSGGPGRDGIPPIDSPTYVSQSHADEWMSGEEPVIAVEVNGRARAYPLQIMVWHEIVNDTLGGREIAVTFCPLCYTAVAFDRNSVTDEMLTFGTTGNLRHSDLVMWDRQTESWWQQYSGEAIVGTLTGHTLEKVPASIISWKDFQETSPGGSVISRDTGHPRDYGQNPYAGYDDVSNTPFLYDGPVGEQLPPMARVVGAESNGEARAYPLDTLEQQRAINDALGGAPVAVFWKEGTRSAVDASSIAGGRDIGATGVFIRLVDGDTLTFEPTADGRFTDRETGSTWTITGEAVEGPLAGIRLESLVHYDTFWFVWSAFQPEGQLFE